MPPFLGYGLLGDNKAIPPRATLVYEIKITNK
jgi:FKBP-type peptidyl-prolyl cis-trans isomerase